jgi:hypothetical protein
MDMEAVIEVYGILGVADWRSEQGMIQKNWRMAAVCGRGACRTFTACRKLERTRRKWLKWPQLYLRSRINVDLRGCKVGDLTTFRFDST